MSNVRPEPEIKNGDFMYKLSGAMCLLLTLFLSVFVSSAHADGIFKWVDESGKVHYTEKPPAKISHTEIHVKPALSDTQADIENIPLGSSPEREAYLRKMKVQEKARELEERVRKASEPKSRKRNNSDVLSDNQAAQDKLLIDKCKSNREDFCDKGIDEINRQNNERRETYENTMNCAMGRGGIGCSRY